MSVIASTDVRPFGPNSVVPDFSPYSIVRLGSDPNDTIDIESLLGCETFIDAVGVSVPLHTIRERVSLDGGSVPTTGGGTAFPVGGVGTD